LTIKDNGIGFVSQVEIREGFGLIGMRERATLLGGSFAGLRNGLGNTD
jgi:signal transduction histidine kinase